MKISKLALAVQSIIFCTPAVVSAQALEEVIVTGTAGGSEMRKLDASFAITNVDEEDIRKFSPQSTADLLKNIPGVWAESSSGVSGANVFVRGFPGGGDAPFLTVQLEGAPVYPPPTLSFLENTTLFRIDETVERMEGLRGGPQSVQDNGQPGLTTNFLLKSGGEETEGLVKYSTSDWDLQRFDAVLSGPLSEGLYYMIGGYVTSSPGIRDAGFTSEKGKPSNFHAYIALIHYPIYNNAFKIITTACTNLDIHDIARSSLTYGVKKFYIVQPNVEQQEVANRVVEHWTKGPGSKYNKTRSEALKIVDIKNSIEEVNTEIESTTGLKPITVVTDARIRDNMIGYSEIKGMMGNSNNPLLILFGTGWGLTKETIESADFILKPLFGFTDYNHLSVRSAAAIILDRLFSCTI